MGLPLSSVRHKVCPLSTFTVIIVLSSLALSRSSMYISALGEVGGDLEQESILDLSQLE